MAKYEIMLIVAGSLDEKAAEKVASDILVSLEKTKVETTKYGNKQLAYQIKKQTHGYYFQYNFETDKVAYINEFRRLCLINKNVLRHLIINLEKDYGYRASNNEKKVKAAQLKAKIYAERKQQYEKMKEARMLEQNASNINDVEEIKQDNKVEKEKPKTTKKTTASKKSTTTKKTKKE